MTKTLLYQLSTFSSSVACTVVSAKPLNLPVKPVDLIPVLQKDSNHPLHGMGHILENKIADNAGALRGNALLLLCAANDIIIKSPVNYVTREAARIAVARQISTDHYYYLRKPNSQHNDLNKT